MPCKQGRISGKAFHIAPGWQVWCSWAPYCTSPDEAAILHFGRRRSTTKWLLAQPATAAVIMSYIGRWRVGFVLGVFPRKAVLAVVARPGSSLEPAPREVYLAKEARTSKQSKPCEALPREMRHFLALLKVHRFEQKRRQEALKDFER